MSALKILARCPHRVRANAAIRALNETDAARMPGRDPWVRELGPSTPPSESKRVRRMVRELRIVQLGSVTLGDLLADPYASLRELVASAVPRTNVLIVVRDPAHWREVETVLGVGAIDFGRLRGLAAWAINFGRLRVLAAWANGDREKLEAGLRGRSFARAFVIASAPQWLHDEARFRSEIVEVIP